MADITLRNTKLFDADSYVGAIVCHTPKTIFSKTDPEDYSNWCRLINNRDDLVKYFGDPFISPKEYSDLILAYDLVGKGAPIFISSIYDMKTNDDDFFIPYNGYTEFMFLDKNRYDTVGYKLKSDIKFCQPVIQFSFDGIDTLELWVHRYILDRSRDLSFLDSISFNSSRLYDSVYYKVKLSYDGDTLLSVDKDIIHLLEKDGFELKIINGTYDTQALIKKFISYREINISLESFVNDYELAIRKNNKEPNPNFVDPYLAGITSRKIEQNDYWYRINSDDYDYCLQMKTDEDKYSHLNDEAITYHDIAISNLSEMFPRPHIISLGELYKSETKISDSQIVDSTGSAIKYTSSSVLSSLLYNDCVHIYSRLLSAFDSECDTYLFINAPDVTASAIRTKLLNEDLDSFDLHDQYNCDMYYGYISDYVASALRYQPQTKIYYSAASLVLYSLLIRKKQYLTNSLHGLNISNTSIKNSITERLARSLTELRCNSIVLFDNGAPSVYGNRSLATSANLRFSHISRTFVYLRRIIREYLETRKFILNTLYNVTSVINYIRNEILDPFTLDSSLSSYNIEYYAEDKTVYITIDLLFYGFSDSITLDFSI